MPAVRIDATNPFCNSNVAGNIAPPSVISPPMTVGKHTWFLALTADGERLMAICRSDAKGRGDQYEHPPSAILVFQRNPSSVEPSAFFWSQVFHLGTHSLFLGLNYPMNLKLYSGQIPHSTFESAWCPHVWFW